jgi:hypothetical protein
LANREFEAWFLAAKESLRGVRGIHDRALPPPAPDDVANAKGLLSSNMEGRRYLEVDDQSALADAMDLQAAERRSPSFGKLLRDLRVLLDALGRSPRVT